VAACARNATHYCGLTAEVHWVQRLIDAHHYRTEIPSIGCRFYRPRSRFLGTPARHPSRMTPGQR